MREAQGERSYDKDIDLLDIATEETALCKLFPKRTVSPQRFSSWDTTLMQKAWAAHFSLVFLVLAWGSMDNHDRKYLSVDPSSVPGACKRAFVDVFASSEEEEGALLCCSIDTGGLLGICDRTPPYLPLARRLSQLPEAWLLPLFPFLLRGLVRLLQYSQTTQQSSAWCRSELTSSSTLRRLTLSTACLLGRGVVLYFLFNMIEEGLVSQPDVDALCWYHEFLKHFQTPCSGRVFDFSDHVVLYFAQLVPVALSETLYCLTFPFWKRNSDNKVIPSVLVGGLLYLYFITFLGAYKTSAYFHTPGEIFTGLAVSLLIQMPLCLLQCSPRWSKARSFLYGQRNASYNTLLIQAR